MNPALRQPPERAGVHLGAAPHLDAYRRLFTQTRFDDYFVNSILVAGRSTLLTILVAGCGAGAVKG